MAIKILTDSSADFDIAEIEAKGIKLVPITFTFGDKSFEDGYDITKDEFFEMLVKSSELPKTAQPSPQLFVDFFEEAKENNDTIIAILLSTELSGTVQCASLAKNMVDYDNVYVIDSASASAGLKIIVERAVEMAANGCSAEEIVAEIENIKAKVSVIAILDTLDNLYKGGRLSKTEASLGTLINIKPLIKVDEVGAVTLMAKNVGRIKATKRLVKEFAEHPADKNYPIYMLYSYKDDNCKAMIELLKSEGLIGEDVNIMQIGGAIGTHIGPNAFGIAYVEA